MKVVAGVLVTAVLGVGMVGLAAVPASASTKCSGDGDKGRCLTASAVKKHVSVVESVPIENDSRKTITVTCAFERTITKSTSASISVTGSVKVSIVKVVDLSTSVSVSNEVTQTASTATKIAATIKLKPGQSVTCERTYGYVSAKIREHWWSGGSDHYRNYTVKVPSYLGARVVD
jgi:hypothetical protein